MRKVIIFLMVAMLLFTFGCKPKIKTATGDVELPDMTKEELEGVIAEKEAIADSMQESLDELEGNYDNPPIDVSDSDLPAESEELEDVVDNEHKFSDGGVATVDGKTVTVQTIGAGPEVLIDVDGTEATFYETKSDEIVEGLIISIQEFHYRLKDSPENYVVLRIEPLELGPDEYLLAEDEIVNIDGKQVVLTEARTDGSVYVDVKPSSGGKKRITAGNTEVYEGIEIGPIQVFTKDKTRINYAILSIVQTEE